MERLEIIDTLKELSTRLDIELAGLSDAVIRFKPSEDDWSVREVMAHMRVAEEVWYKRLYQVWALNDPMLATFDSAGYDAAMEEARQAPSIAPYVDYIRTNRPRIIGVLVHAVDWTRLGNWRGVGRRTLKQLAEALVEHDADHIQQIRALKAAAATPSR